MRRFDVFSYDLEEELALAASREEDVAGRRIQATDEEMPEMRSHCRLVSAVERP